MLHGSFNIMIMNSSWQPVSRRNSFRHSQIRFSQLHIRATVLTRN